MICDLTKTRNWYFCCTNCGSVFKIERNMYTDDMLEHDTTIPKNLVKLPSGDDVWFHDVCKGRIVGPIDKLLIEVIPLFFIKGYDIKNSSGGHEIERQYMNFKLFKNVPYSIVTDGCIEFDRSIHYTFDDIMSIKPPKGWFWDETAKLRLGKCQLRHTSEDFYPPSDEYDIWTDEDYTKEYLSIKTINLLEWVMTLPTVSI